MAKKIAAARSTSKGKQRTPEVGDVYCYQIEQGIHGVRRILQFSDQNPLGLPTKPQSWWLLATSAWFGKEAPSLDEPLLRKILCITHHSQKGEPALMWVPGKPPADWQWLGSILPTTEEQNLKCTCIGQKSNWISGIQQALTQWRWDHDREALLRQEEQENKDLVQRYSDAAKAELAKLASTPLPELRDRKHFAHWRSFAEPIAIKESERIVRETIDALIEPHAAKNEQVMLKVMQEGVAKINRLQREKSCLMTIERDDLVTKFQELFHICGLDGKLPQLEQWVEF